MIKNGLYALSATPRDGATDDVGGVLILRDGEIRGGDAYVYYTGNYECSAANNWQGKMTSQKNIPPPHDQWRPECSTSGSFGTYNEAGAKVDAMAVVGEQNIRYDATLRLLIAT